MEKCKYCQQELEEGSTVCPHCGKDNGTEEQTPVSQEPAAEEKAEAECCPECEEKTEQPAAETAEASEESETAEGTEEKPAGEQEESGEKPEAEEDAESEEDASEEKKDEEAPKKATPGQIAMGVGAIVILAAVLVALIISALGQKKEDVDPDMGTTAVETTAAAETTEPQETVPPTVPEDGNPDDATCKGTYSVLPEEVEAAGDEIVASMAEFTLNNRQLQIYYWKTVQMFQQSNPYANYIIDWSLPLDVQPCMMAEGMTWQQFFLQTALETWQNYQSMAAEADANKIPENPEVKKFLNELPEEIEKQAEENGYEDGQALLTSDVGPGPRVKDYLDFMKLYYRGEGYFNYFLSVAQPDEQELEAYFQENKDALAENGITKDGKAVDVRHVLITPEEPSEDESWKEAEKKAQELLMGFEAGEKTEEAFAAMATEHSMDPGSKETGGLYEHVVLGQMVPEFEGWCFDAGRKTGDTGIVKTDYGYHIMFYSGDQTIWQEQTARIYLNEKVQDLMARNAATYPLTVEYEKVVLGTPERLG